MDNCSACILFPKLQKVKIVFFSCQLDCNFAASKYGYSCFKSYYRKHLVTSILVNIENKAEHLFKAVNVKETCNNIGEK